MPTTARPTGSLPRRRRSNPNPNPNPNPDPDPDPSPSPKPDPNPKPNPKPKPNLDPNQAVPENITVLRRKVSCPGASDKHEPRFLEDCGKRRRAVVKGGRVVGAGKGAERNGNTGQPAKVSRRRKKLSEGPLASRSSASRVNSSSRSVYTWL